ncbi:MAG TPA: bestrophin family ion channel [Variovorax sp.]|nr:bestrophin family ion channel [Variovorax sp.]
MIVQRSLNLRRVLAVIGPPLLVLLVYDVAVTYLYMVEDWKRLGLDNLPLPLVGTAVALVVTLRNNAAYARWWEGRMLWGQIVNDSRSFVRGLIAMTGDTALQIRLTKQQVAYTQALRMHLLRSPPWEDMRRLLPPETIGRVREAANVPLALQTDIADRLGRARVAGHLDAIGMAALHVSLSALASAQGGLERIKNTPLARQYSQFPRIFVRVFCLLLPLGMVHDLGWFTPLGSALVGFMFLALDQVGIDLEDPFEGRLHDVPMQAITRAIEVDLHQMIGHLSEPPAVEVERGVLN